jgi:hypothetical protein
MSLKMICCARLWTSGNPAVSMLFTSLVLLTLFGLPAASSAQIGGVLDGSGSQACASNNPNPNPNPAASVTPNDFNGDCKSDVAWQNTNSQLAYAWLMNGSAIAGQGSLNNPGPGWVIQGSGDFDGNGTSDLLWRNSTTGEVYVWFMNGASVASASSLGSVSSDWSIAGVGDFNGDGKSDILWRNSTSGLVYLWLMNGSTIASQGSIYSVTSDWNIAGVGDFNGDGKADILWQNGTSGLVYMWLMNGISIASQSGIIPVSYDWSIAGIGDFNGDGKSDILWRNESSGAAEIWLMNGASISSSGIAGNPAAEASTSCCSGVGNGWTVVGVGDYNGDGKADILWRQLLTTGQVYVWLMNGVSISNQSSIGYVSADWQLPTPAPYGCSNQVLCNILAETNNIRANGPWGSGNPAPSSTAGGQLFPVVWDPGAATVARSWAAQCNFVVNPHADGGENLAANYPTGSAAVDAWASEASGYNYSANTCPSGACGHYTQVVWRNTAGMGCAVQLCTSGTFGSGPWSFVVCDYTPAGNVNGLRPY